MRKLTYPTRLVAFNPPSPIRDRAPFVTLAPDKAPSNPIRLDLFPCSEFTHFLHLFKKGAHNPRVEKVLVFCRDGTSVRSSPSDGPKASTETLDRLPRSSEGPGN
jgi:hypothetical protein